ncbi:MAG TPA: DUF502 domain-containing protein [Syntrophorhabdaceae bacterium]|nr:DUF502 domain-containing protein [Syntrophorhabdaceae bacterium]
MSVAKHLKKKFITGLFVLIPLIVTAYIIYVVVSFIEGFIGPALKNIFFQVFQREVYVTGTACIIFVVITYLTGLFVSNYFGKTLFSRGERLVKRIPIVKSIYGSVKDMMEAFSSEKIKSFKEVVLIEFPFQGRYAIGLVTNRVEIGGIKHCAVFVPTTPNPTSGYIIITKEEELLFLDMATDDALKYIISLGTSRSGPIWNGKRS